MRFAAICCFALGVGALTAQQPSVPVSVRSITVRPVSTSSAPLNAIDFEAFSSAWKARGIHLAVEIRLEPAAVDKAADVIRDMYRDRGQKVRVEHTVKQIRPGAVEVAFEIIQLCPCN